MTEEELAAMFGPVKVAELEAEGHWPVPAWLLPYILERTKPDPIEVKKLGIELAESFLPSHPHQAKQVKQIFRLEG